MPLVATQRKNLEDLVAGVDGYMYENFVNKHFHTVTLGGTSTVDPIGTPVIWNGTNSQFEVYVAQDIQAVITAGTSPLPGKEPIAILVGDRFGVGFNEADIDLATDGPLPVTVLATGSVNILEDGIAWGTAAAPAQALFRTQLYAQDIVVDTNATEITPTNLIV